MADVVAIICGWQEATTYVSCENCGLPMVEQDRRLQWCADCREQIRLRPAKAKKEATR